MDDMTRSLQAEREASFQHLFDFDSGMLDRRAFSDEAVYRLEMERIFARGWNFMCHESQLKETGDYLINYIGEDQLIVVRAEDGEINAMINSCRHRGNTLCRAEIGRAKSFVCSYHGWNYGLDGRLIGVPGQKTFYRGDVDRSKLGLARARVENYRGMYFATLDPEAPSLYDYLGEVGRAGIELIYAQGDVEVVNGIQKNIVDCNWKIAVDNVLDWYHVAYSHSSAAAAGMMDVSTFLYPKDQIVVLGEYGHAIGGPSIPRDVWSEVDQLSDEDRAERSKSLPDVRRFRSRAVQNAMGNISVRTEGHPNIFPNLWITYGGHQLCLRIPRGPSKTELWWYTLLPKHDTQERRDALLGMTNHVFGPAGFLEQDDGDNWSHSTRAAQGVASQKLGQNLAMGLGHDRVQTADTGERYVEGWIAEHGQRWVYQAWLDWLRAPSWEALKADHTAVPTGVI